MVQSLHLVDIAGGTLGNVLAVVGDGSITAQQGFAHLVEGGGGCLQSLHLLADTRHLAEILLGGIGEFGHARELVAGSSHLGNALAQRHGILFAQVDALRQSDGRLSLSGIDIDVDALAITAASATDDDTAATGEVRTVLRILAGQDGKDLLPVIFLLGTVKGGEHKHKHLGTHTHTEQKVAQRHVQNLEQGTQDNDSGTDTISKVEKTLATVALEESACFLFISLDFTHLYLKL